MQHYTRVLTIAGSDSSGGAGIQADLKTFSVFNCYGMSVITALTAQNTLGVQAIHAVPADFVRLQLQSVLDDIGVDAIKIGMLCNSEIIKIVIQQLQRYAVKNIVLDPVMVAKGGSVLLSTTAINHLKQMLPLATLVTPNLMEAEVLTGNTITNKQEMEQAAQKIYQLGAQSVLIKGGHLTDDKFCNDCLYVGAVDEIHWLSAPRINTLNTHGTGCTLSSAIAAQLAKGKDLLTAVNTAKDYINSVIEIGSRYSLGHGHGPVYQLFNKEKCYA